MKPIAMLLALLLLLGAAEPFALASGGAPGLPVALPMAFGLYSIDLPEGARPVRRENDSLSMECFDIKGLIVRANYAPIEEYEYTAGRALNSYISYLFTQVSPGAGGGYRETPVQELELDGVTVHYQLMLGGSHNAFWLEAFTENYGYNVSVLASNAQEPEALLKAICESFRIDPGIEADRVALRQTMGADGAAVSVDHGLSLKVGPDWYEATPILMPNSAFALEKDNAELLIQVLCVAGVNAEDTQAVFTQFIEMRQAQFPDATWGEQTTIQLENLGGIEALCQEEKSPSGFYSLDIGFVYQDHCYVGSFMWMGEPDGAGREEQMEAIRSISPGAQR